MFKKVGLFGLLLAVSLVLTVTAAVEKKAEDTVVCAVSGKKMEKSEAKGTYEYKGKTYYFCCDGCKSTFLKNPEKYASGKANAEHAHAEHAENEHEHAAHTEKGQEHSQAEGKEAHACCDTGHGKNLAEGMAIDPVCNMKVKKAEAKATLEHNGRTYYFCMEGCKEKFQANPEKYEMVSCTVSGKEVKKEKALTHEHKGKTYYFCCEGCVEKFKGNPDNYLKK
jgi:Cu+-exporting ATPase